MGVGGQRHAPAALNPREKTRYPLYRRLGGAPGLVRTGVENLAAPPNQDSIPFSTTLSQLKIRDFSGETF